MALQQRIDGTLIDNRVRLTGGTSGGVAGWPSAAWYCEPMTAGVVIDDPLGDLDLFGWHYYTADETADTAHPRIFTGWLSGLRISRGPYRTGPGRVWDCDIIDQNALFSFEVFRANSAQRPAETDVERVLWGRASAPMAGTGVYDNGRLSTAGPLNLGATDYVTLYPGELFGATASQCGKNVYAYWDDTTETLGLHYDLVVNNPLSSVTISNVRSDITGWSGGSVFGPRIDAVLDRDPTQVYTGVLYGWLGGWLYGRNAATIDDLSPTDVSPVNFLRDTVYRTDRVGRLTTAQSQLAGMLADLAHEKETITCTVRLPAERVNELHAGTAVRVRFEHLPGYEHSLSDPVVVAVNRRTVVPAPGRRDWYDVNLELSNDGQTARGPGGGDPGVVPVPAPACSAGNIQIIQSTRATVTNPTGNTNTRLDGAAWPAPPEVGHLLIAVWTMHAGQTPIGSMTGWTEIVSEVTSIGLGGQAGVVSMFYKIATASEPTAKVQILGNSGVGGNNLAWDQMYLIEVAGVDTFDTFVQVSINVDDKTPGGPITPTAGKVAFLLTACCYSTSNAGTGTPKAGVIELYEEGIFGATGHGGNPQRWLGYQVVSATSGSYDVNMTIPTSGYDVYSASVTAAFYCSGVGGATVPPRTGQLVRGEFVWAGDGTTTSGTTLYHYAPGSLDVFVDGVPIINGVTETDPETGAFSLDFAPKAAAGDTAAERVTVNYMVLVG